MKTVTVYTDGACSGNPGPGGYGAVLQFVDSTARRRPPTTAWSYWG